MITQADAAAELLRRRVARTSFFEYVKYTMPSFKPSAFSQMVCEAIDQFIIDVEAGLRPILVLKAPPQHGKSELVSRRLPAYLMGRFANMNVSAASYSSGLAGTMSQAVRRNIKEERHLKLFPPNPIKQLYPVDRAGEFSNPNGSGTYVGDGIGGGFTGRPTDIFIVDDPVKNSEEALSPTIKESHWNWYQSTMTTRLSEHSGQIIMATAWAEDDLIGKVCSEYEGDPRLTVLAFPAINDPNETNYRPDLPLGPLVPKLKSLTFLQEIKKLFSDYWWSAIYQSSPKPVGGNVFKDEFAQYYLPKDLPTTFDLVISSWDCTFKDTDGTDYVVGQVWGKKGSSAYLLDQVRDRMSFTRTAHEIKAIRNKWPQIREILIEDKANGPAVIDFLKESGVHGLIPVEPDGSKLARAHAVTAPWEARNVYIPSKDIAPWVKGFIAELTTFPAAANDDQVDATTQALRRLFPVFNVLRINTAALANAARRA